MNNFKYFQEAKSTSNEVLKNREDTNSKYFQMYNNSECNLNTLFNKFHFEKFSGRMDFCIITNHFAGKTTHGKLIKLNGNFHFVSSIPYYVHSLVSCYKTKYFVKEGNLTIFYLSSIEYFSFYLNEEKIKAKEAIELLFDVQGIRFFKGSKKEKAIKKQLNMVMNYRFPEKLIRFAIKYIFN